MNQNAETTGTFITKAGKFCFALMDKGGFKNGDKSQENCSQAMWFTLHQKSNIGTERARMVGLHISIEIPAAGSSNEWLEEVSDKEYNKLK
mgnify:CR=1 FL=1